MQPRKQVARKTAHGPRQPYPARAGRGPRQRYPARAGHGPRQRYPARAGHGPRQPYSPPAYSPPASRRPYTVRSVVIFELALSIAIVVYFLLRAAHCPPADAALGALGIFGVAQVLANNLIE
jgi:hypothetical protein